MDNLLLILSCTAGQFLVIGVGIIAFLHLFIDEGDEE